MRKVQEEGMMLPLTELPAGMRARIRLLRGTPEARRRLREMGMFENAIIRCIHNRNGKVICDILQSRIGLPRDVAHTIVVSHVDEE
jgi:Fe2+ transport system protein FeoA